MSETRDIDQNGGATKESTCESRKVEVSEMPPDPSASMANAKSTTTDTSLNIQFEAQSQSALTNATQDQEGTEKVNNSTNEKDDTVAKIDQEEVSNHSRELKSLLALSKEANLDTNIPRKRKSTSVKRKLEGEARLSSGKGSRIQYPVTAEAELEMDLHAAEGSKIDFQDDDGSSASLTLKGLKRKKTGVSETSGDSIHEDSPRKNRKPFIGELPIFKPDKDMFCWRCHKDTVNISCETCPRSYHQKCLKQTITDPDHWPCPECVSILKAESTNSRSTAMREMTLEHLCNLLKFAAQRMSQCQGSEPFIHAVNDNDFPEYKKYIIQPMNLTLLEKNIKDNVYGSTQAFEADAKWILHNSIVFNSYANCANGKKYQSKLTSVAKTIIKICKQEMSEIENCPCCYLNANTKKKTWFVEVCPKPHLLVWAKLRGFPYWPGKAMSCKDGMVDVRFFGAHDRAWVPEKECFLYTPKDPNLFRVKRADIEQCVEELEMHVENLKSIYAEFNYPPFKTPIDSGNELKQLQMFLPRYKAYFHTNKAKKQGMDNDALEVKEEINDMEFIIGKTREKLIEEVKVPQRRKDKGNTLEDETMEGYGTDDESVTDIDTEMRKNLLKMPENSEEIHIDEDDTQVADTGSLGETDLNKDSLKGISVHMRVMLKKSDSEPCSKRSSVDERRPYRRNSESKADISRSADRISKVNISEDMEVSLGKEKAVNLSENISSSNSECSSDFSVDSKKRPVQVNVDNVEFTISPARKLKMADTLIKRLSDGDSGGEGPSSNTDGKLKMAKRSLASQEEASFEGVSVSSILDNETKDQDEMHNDGDSDIGKSFKSQGGNYTKYGKPYEKIGKTHRPPRKEDLSKRTSKDVANKKRSVSLAKTGRNKIVSKMCKSEQKIENNETDLNQPQSVATAEPFPNRADEEMVQQPSLITTPNLDNPVPKRIVPPLEASKEDKYSSSSEDDDSTILATLVKNKSSSVDEESLTKEVFTKSRDSDQDDDETIESIDLRLEKANIINIIHSSLVNKNTSSTKHTDSDAEESQGKKRKKSTDSNDSIPGTQNKLLKLVTIESIMNNNNQIKLSRRPGSRRNYPSTSKRNSINEASTDEGKNQTESEADSDGVQDLEAKRKYLSALNILEKGEADIQKPKLHEIRTRSKTEEKRERLRVSKELQIADNMSKTIEDVAANYNAVCEVEGDAAVVKQPTVAGASKADGGEIFVKSFAKLVPDSSEGRNSLIPTLPSKQRARKSFPHPNYAKPVEKSNVQTAPATDQQQAALVPVTEMIPRLIPRTGASTSPITTVVSTATPVHTSKTAAVAPLQQLDTIRPTNGYLILQPQQQDNVVFIPPNQTLSYSAPIASQVMSVTPCLVSSSGNTTAIRHLTTQTQIWHPGPNAGQDRKCLNVSRSQNYIPQGEPPKSVSSPVAVKSGVQSSTMRVANGMPELSFNASSTEAAAATVTPTTSRQSENQERSSEAINVVSEVALATESPEIGESVEDDEFSVLNSTVHENISRAVNDIIRRPPPKLKPRPPGVLSQQFNEGLPSSTGPVTARVNSVAHRLGDYFRGMLIETLEDLGKSNNPEATISSLKLEIETLKHKHEIEISEIEKNMTTVLKDIQRTVIEERDRVIEDTKAACEAEAIKRVEEAKSKQWCASCLKEAQFYCCWNTSYCDYPCQQKHWPIHMNKCSQNASQSSQTNPSTTVRPSSQQLILRPANPPTKRGVGRVFSKPVQKVYMNRNLPAPKTVRMQSTATNLLTMMETTPGNFQIITTNSLLRTGPPTITPIKAASVIPVSSVNSTNQQQKNPQSKAPIRVGPITGVLEEQSE